MVANLSLLPLSRLIQAHDLVLTLEAATMGDALQLLETADVDWSAIDGFDEVTTVVDGIANDMD